MSFPGESPVARWKGKRRSQVPATENVPGRRKSRAVRPRCALPGFLPVGQTCLSSFIHAPPENLKAFFGEKYGPNFFPGVFFIRRAPAASESVALQCRGACVFQTLALCRRQRCPTERKRVLLRRTFVRAFVNGREMCRSPGAASRPQRGVFWACAALIGAESRASGGGASVASSAGLSAGTRLKRWAYGACT